MCRRLFLVLLGSLSLSSLVSAQEFQRLALQPAVPLAYQKQLAKQRSANQQQSDDFQGFRGSLERSAVFNYGTDSDSSDGFMGDALKHFANLKTSSSINEGKRDISSLNDQRLRETQAKRANKVGNNEKSKSLGGGQSLGFAAGTSMSVAEARNDDEAFLESGSSSAADNTHSKPTDIADIIGDSKPSEQRFISSFQPSIGPFGRPLGPPPALPGPAPLPRRRPAPPPLRPAARTPYSPPGSFDYFDDNYLGSGNFEVLSGGVFRDPGDYVNDYGNPRPSYQQNDGYAFGPFLDDFFTNFRDFADINQDNN